MAQTWQTVRIFISSTFRDMQAERDHLVKIVFPELRERCAERRLHLIDLDLRWGVTEEEAEQGKVLEVILGEIDRARPFFVAMLGERYGYIPENIPEGTESTHAWLGDYPGHSITALEIIHGVLRDAELAKRSFFYFRDPSVISQVPESKRADFSVETPEAARKLASLKDEIRASGRPVFEDYPCRWDDEAGCLTDLETFGRHILDSLFAAICEEFPADAPETDPLAVERQMHRAFVEEHAHLYTGRGAEANRLTAFVRGEDPRPIVITGESGCGKSAFLANWSRQYAAEHPADFLLPYFIGASPESTNHLLLLRRMCEELRLEFSLTHEIPEEDRKLSETLLVFLSAAAGGKKAKRSLWDLLRRGSQDQEEGRRVIVLLDALDQLSGLEGAHGLGWLLEYIPQGVRFVVSTLEGDCLDVLRRHGAEEMALPELERDNQSQIVQSRLGEWGRKLDSRQVECLLRHPGVSNPLYLRMALEELKLFGKFEFLTARIEDLPADVPGLLDQMLERLENDHGTALVAETFSLLGSSRHGLSEAEILELLERRAERLPPARWARLARSARACLVQRGELIDFSHSQLRDAVATRYLSRDDKHADLASYFGQAPLDRKLDEYAFQLQQAEQVQQLAATLSDLDLFDYAWERRRTYEWMGYWRSLEGRFEPGECYRTALQAREEEGGKSQETARLLNRVGLFLCEMGESDSGMQHIERALAMFEDHLGQDELEVATILSNLATLYLQMRMYPQALPLATRALAIGERVLHPDDPQIATYLGNLAAVYKEQGRYAEALPILKRIVAVKERSLGPDHVEVAVGLNNLAGYYRSMGKLGEALSLYERALSIKERNLGPWHPQIAIALSNMAGVYKDKGQFARAMPLYERALTIEERAYGPDHPGIATILNNLAVCHGEEGSLASARPLLERALAIDESAFGPDHPEVAVTLNNMAALCRAEKKYSDAGALFRRALDINERTLGRDHITVAVTLNNLALLYCEQGDYADAVPLLERAVASAERTLGPGHKRTKAFAQNLSVCRSRVDAEGAASEEEVRTAASLNKQATALYKQGRFSEAMPLYERVLATYERALSSVHPEVAVVLNNLAMVYRRVGRDAEALPLLERALDIQEKLFGPEHPHVAACLNNLGGYYHSQGRCVEALPILERALAIREGALGPDHPDVANSLNGVAEVLRALHRHEEALPLYQRAVGIVEPLLGPHHHHTRVFRGNLESCLESMN